MSEKVKGIVIKSNDRKEKDKNILLFSLEKGKCWATLKGVKNSNAKMKTAQNPFSFGEFLLQEGKAGMIVTGFESIENFHEISEDVDKFFEASAILEIVDKLEFSCGDVAKVFVLTLKGLKSLCFGNIKTNYVLCKFFIELFRLYGFPFYSEKCSGCGTKVFSKLYVSYSVGELVCVNCKNLTCEELAPATYTALKILNNTSFEKLSSLKLAEGSELKLLKVLVKNFESRFSVKLKLIGILS